MENHLLIYGKEYDLWREGKYIGSAFYVDDENIGDCFQKGKLLRRNRGVYSR